VINHLRIKNFKAWLDTGNVRMAPLTVLFGTNSAGKTSIAQLLLLLKQTAESSDRQRPLHFGDDNTLVDLGDFEGVVHGHDPARHVEFEIGWDLDERLRFSDAYTRKKYETGALVFKAEVSSLGGGKLQVERFDYALDSGTKSMIHFGMRAKDTGKFSLTSDKYKPVYRQGRKWALPAPYHFFGFPDEAVAYYQNTSVLADLNLEMSRLLDSVLYVGPLREKPKRLYRWSGETPPHVGERGERSIEAVLAGRERRFNFKTRQPLQNLDVLVADRLKQVGLIHDFQVEPVADGRKEYEVRVITREGAPSVLLTDVGFGVSQVLPVIVESFYVPPRSVVIFEQPEIHLHPAVQAELADLFIDAIKARENGKDREIQFIIESHSEHFLRRLQRRIAEERLSPEDAALYFVHSEGSHARLEELSIDAYGRIGNWPEAFFGDALGETEAQMTRMMDRMIAEKEKGR
jgi:hypothetical protein